MSNRMSPEQALAWMAQVVEDYANTMPPAVRVAFTGYANMAVPIVQNRLRDAAQLEERVAMLTPKDVAPSAKEPVALPAQGPSAEPVPT